MIHSMSLTVTEAHDYESKQIPTKKGGVVALRTKCSIRTFSITNKIIMETNRTNEKLNKS